MEHRNATTNRHIRQLIQSSPKTIRQLADELSLSPTTVWKWKNAGRLENHSSRPHHIRYSLSKLEERILVTIRRHLRISVSECVQLLEPYFPHLQVMTAYRILARYGLSVLPHPFRSVGKFPQYLPGFFHMDLAYLPVLGERVTRKYLLVAIDRTTKLLFLMIVPGKHQDHTIRFLKTLVSWCPYRIHHLLTDNGREFGKRFSETCTRLGMIHRHTKVKHPWTNGQAEITVKLVKQETVWVTFYRSYRHLDRSLTMWLNAYNFNRKLKRLKENTPYQETRNWREKKQNIFVRPVTKKMLRVRYIMS